MIRPLWVLGLNSCPPQGQPSLVTAQPTLQICVPQVTDFRKRKGRKLSDLKLNIVAYMCNSTTLGFAIQIRNILFSVGFSWNHVVLAFELLSLITHTVAVFSQYVSDHIIYLLPRQAEVDLTLCTSLTLNSEVGDFCFVLFCFSRAFTVAW